MEFQDGGVSILGLRLLTSHKLTLRTWRIRRRSKSDSDHLNQEQTLSSLEV